MALQFWLVAFGAVSGLSLTTSILSIPDKYFTDPMIKVHITKFY